jgi:hypothetical protein
VNSSLERKRPDDERNHRLVAVVADAHLHLVLEVDPLDELEEPVHEVLARLLAVRDDIDPGVLLLLEPEQGRVALRVREFLALNPPRGPQLVGFRQPARFGRLPAMVVSNMEVPPQRSLYHARAAGLPLQ